MSEPFKYIMNYRGYDLEMVMPFDQIKTISDADKELADTIEKHPEMTFVSKNWKSQ